MSEVVYRNGYPFVPLQFERLSAEEMQAQADAFYQRMDQRRSVREFSTEPVPRALLERAILAASTAPSGAHRQPWQFVAVSDPALKKRIREAAEAEERDSYGGRMPPDWLDALAPLGTDADKPYLETVPWIVVLFEVTTGTAADGSVQKNYYVRESCGIAAGMFITALHSMGLATLTHTPSPMKFLTELLGRPATERPFVLFPVGYPAADACVPQLSRKSLEQISTWHTGD